MRASPYNLWFVGGAGVAIYGGFAPLVSAVGVEVGAWLGEAGWASLSAYGRGARNYFTYFFVYSARCSDAPARGLGQSRGHQWGGRR